MCLAMKTHVLRRKSFGALNFFSPVQLFLPGFPTFSLPRLTFAVVSCSGESLIDVPDVDTLDTLEIAIFLELTN